MANREPNKVLRIVIAVPIALALWLFVPFIPFPRLRGIAKHWSDPTNTPGLVYPGHPGATVVDVGSMVWDAVENAGDSPFIDVHCWGKCYVEYRDTNGDHLDWGWRLQVIGKSNSLTIVALN